MRKGLAFLFSAIVVVGCLNGCHLEKDATVQDVEQVYIAYMEATKVDQSAADQKYCHYELKEYMELDAQNKTNNLEYEILEWEKLSAQLWAVTSFVKTPAEPEGYQMTQYVGLVDGSYRVMKREFHIPSDLKQDIDFSKYIPTGDNILG